ncbi:MAG: peptidoglycan editing factor PgeF [Candidatus Hydrogenedens sp.]
MVHLQQLEKIGLSFAGILRKEDIAISLPEVYSSKQLLSILNQNTIYPQILCRVKQEHSNNIYVFKNQQETNSIPADGIITCIPKVAVCISVADCVPIFLFDKNKQILGMIHAGREGTRKRIVQKALEKFVREFNTNLRDVAALIGPSIGPCCYKLPGELLSQCSKEGLITTDRNTLDLWKSNEKQLTESGVETQNLFILSECTYCNDNYFSYRRGDKKLRNYAIGMI